MDYSTHTHLQTVCDVKQPVLFDYETVCPEFFENLHIVGNDEIQVKEVADYWRSDEPVESVLLPLSSGLNLLTTDTRSQYISENNEAFLIQSGVAGNYSVNDEYLKPYFSCQTTCDVWFGSRKAATPLRYHIDARQFLCVFKGRIRIKMTPWKSRKYLYPIKDYENLEFRSPINCWNPQQKYLHEMDKVKFLEFDVAKGQVLYIPPYWWYSIQYIDSGTTVCSITYKTAVGCIANLPEYTYYLLQQQNTRTRVAKVLKLEESKESTESEKSEQPETVQHSDTTPLEQSIQLLTVNRSDAGQG
jgi:hypothetical protein